MKNSQRVRNACIHFLLPLAALAGVPSFAAPPDLQHCNIAGFETILQPAAMQVEASAYWLNRSTIKWPNARKNSKVGRFQLVYSDSAAVFAKVGEPLKGALGAINLSVSSAPLPPALATRFKYVVDGVVLLVAPADAAKLAKLHSEQMLVVETDAQNNVVAVAALQLAGALDDRYSNAAKIDDFGVSAGADNTAFKLWAPTATSVQVCTYPTGAAPASNIAALTRDASTGAWSGTIAKNLNGNYYKYLVEVYVPNVGIVRNAVTDPYSISLTTNSTRSYIADLSAADLKPPLWDKTPAPSTVKTATDMSVYELHVRDFSIGDLTVSAANRGKYRAFTETQSNGMKHLKALADAGLTDIHLLPIFDIATIPEAGCVTPAITGTVDGLIQQEIATKNAASDCFNWGYDPYHYTAPEGSYASSAADGVTRIIETREMVQALHRAGLRVGMDVVYNHTSASGQALTSVLDRIVPGYYQRYNNVGKVEESTCCANTATENLMMGKLMIDSVITWATQYKMDSFRFDLMGHQPRAVMVQLQQQVNKAAGRTIQLLGEGWNFGEVENGKRFVQASQLSLNGTGIGSFSDRGRDAVRGGSYDDSGDNIIKRQGYINGLNYDRNALNTSISDPAALLRAADFMRVMLAGSVRDYRFITADGTVKKLENIDYNKQPAGFAREPSEAVNYVENHDNQTLFDLNVYRLPLSTSREDRARVQMLGAALVAFSQGVAYYHAGLDVLRSKSFDGNSYDSGDWFNRLDFTYTDNGFAAGLPPKRDNEKLYPYMQPLLANPAIKPTSVEINLSKDMFRDLLKIRASSKLFRLDSTAEIVKRLTFHNVGEKQIPTVIAGHLNGTGLAGANFKEVLYFINVDVVEQTLAIDSLKGKPWQLHPVQARAEAADKRVAAQARAHSATGKFVVPARSAVVFVR
jgi:pullulanase